MPFSSARRISFYRTSPRSSTPFFAFLDFFSRPARRPRTLSVPNPLCRSTTRRTFAPPMEVFTVGFQRASLVSPSAFASSGETAYIFPPRPSTLFFICLRFFCRPLWPRSGRRRARSSSGEALIHETSAGVKQLFHFFSFIISGYCSGHFRG
ncbi:hypothetical protein DGI_3537 [Megalodesulfovibrio gigas DSM 1382 = ATCC 19364]|uniref:Uncharacterized protein n=1 Tax=Megalodesulfovibrio gigas (strain ATCC 19364 / DSM 1382 / NCIMB 9332 / VKM B-1759) TaxID=1121448 RepID=T2GFW7_MEGG1|nr:hypothetical protein DGI_3537 [Megalodesulfovibrio gigas DSM 1382 = ATCC 19364]